MDISPRTIEAIAVALFIIVVVVGISCFAETPKADLTRDVVIKLIEAIVGALGFVSLLLVWAQLRHTAVLTRLWSYHRYFHDLPNHHKVMDLYMALSRCKVPVPTWETPLNEIDLRTLLSDCEGAPGTAELVIREYLNDFEEFASAINCGLVDESYAFQLEGARSLNAYYGFKVVITHWLDEDRRIAEKRGHNSPITTNYYGELRSVADRWRTRKIALADKEAKAQEKRRIADKF